MNTVTLKQVKPLQVNIFGYSFLILTPLLWYYNDDVNGKIGLFLLIGLILIGYSVTYEINKEFSNFKRLNVFGLTVWKEELKLFFPEYISFFSASFNKDNDWGAVAALGTQSKNQSFVIKFFKGSKNKTVYKSNDYTMALNKANELSKLLEVKVHNALKK